MPSAIDPPSVPTPGQPVIGNRGHQKVALEVDFHNKSLKGVTEITVYPTDQGLRQIKLNSRQCNISRCSINQKSAQVKYSDPYQEWTIYPSSTVHQHGLLRNKVKPALQDPLALELVITVPSRVKIEPVDVFNEAAHQALKGANASTRPGTPGVPTMPNGVQTPALTGRPEHAPYHALNVRIEYTIENIRDGFTFVGCDAGDRRYPHAYTTNSPLPGSSCCLFPTLDGIHEQWTWEIEVTVPKTINDMDRTADEDFRPHLVGIDGDEEPEDVDMAEESDIEFVVVCNAELIDEDTNDFEPWKKTVKFSQNTPVAPQHISIAVGPFEIVNLSEFRDQENEETMGDMAIQVVGYALPGRAADLRNTCMFLPKAIDFLVESYGKYPFIDFRLCFVDDLATDTVETASVVLCSNRLLFPETALDPIWDVTRTLTYALCSQWSGVWVVPKEWADLWVIVGLCGWMSNNFIKSLMGNNELRFQLKKDQERVMALDIGRPALYAQAIDVPIDPEALDFMKLKARLVITILEKRLWKLSSSMVLDRAARKIFLSANTGELRNGVLSTAHFMRICEKCSHNKIDQFFKEYVYGAGYPVFQVSQRFNKKRMIVEMGIRQVQATETPPRKVNADEFLSDARDRNRGVAPGVVQSVFTGPMTIRIHEADGTPYEHVVDIKEGYTKLDIPYNTKYKRLKRSRRQKERAAVGAGVDINIDAQNDDVLLYCLGDILQSDDEMREWDLADWTKEDEERMNQESFEWIRMDADFEWICSLSIGQPDYMFASQLQQDRDVIAQYDSIKHFATIRESRLVSTILLRTVMDRRYFHGIRVEAAKALARCATEDLAWIGFFHLMRAFQEFFCFPGSTIPRSNDFSDQTAYVVQKAIPQAISTIRNKDGECPPNVQMWLLELLRYNDNSTNTYNDSYYVASLMSAVANTLTPGNRDQPDDMELDHATHGEEIKEEIERFQKMDQYHPSYRNIISETALEIQKHFVSTGLKKLDYKVFLAYTREGTLDTLRVKAFDCLIDLGALRVPALQKYISHAMATDPSPYIRRRVQRAFGRGLGMIAMGQDKKANPSAAVIDMIIDDGGDNARQMDRAKENISGAMASLKEELKNDDSMKDSIWQAVLSKDIGLLEVRYLLDICQILYDTKNSMNIVLKFRKHLTVEKVNKGVLKFRWKYPVLPPRPSLVVKPPPPRPTTIKLALKPQKANGIGPPPQKKIKLDYKELKAPLQPQPQTNNRPPTSLKASIPSPTIPSAVGHSPPPLPTPKSSRAYSTSPAQQQRKSKIVTLKFKNKSRLARFPKGST